MLTATITWRPVADGLPDADLCVLIACDTAFHSEPVWLGYHDGQGWREANGEPAFVTHWATMPPPPDAGVSSAPAHSKSEYKRRVAQGDPNVLPPVQGRERER